jgi:hypothetical protein
LRREVNDATAGAIAVPPVTRLIMDEVASLLDETGSWNSNRTNK